MKVTYESAEHAIATKDYEYYKKGSIGNFEEIFDIEEGYFIEFYKINEGDWDKDDIIYVNEDSVVSVSKLSSKEGKSNFRKEN